MPGNISKSLEQRVFEAFKTEDALVLSFKEVISLMRDDAFATRVTAVAAEEAGVEHDGHDAVEGYRGGETWSEFKRRLKRVAKGKS
jgi:hypothetical protein